MARAGLGLGGLRWCVGWSRLVGGRWLVGGEYLVAGLHAGQDVVGDVAVEQPDPRIVGCHVGYCHRCW